jgi:hypothetical protein
VALIERFAIAHANKSAFAWLSAPISLTISPSMPPIVIPITKQINQDVYAVEMSAVLNMLCLRFCMAFAAAKSGSPFCVVLLDEFGKLKLEFL